MTIPKIQYLQRVTSLQSKTISQLITHEKSKAQKKSIAFLKKIKSQEQENYLSVTSPFGKKTHSQSRKLSYHVLKIKVQETKVQKFSFLRKGQIENSLNWKRLTSKAIRNFSIHRKKTQNERVANIVPKFQRKNFVKKCVPKCGLFRIKCCNCNSTGVDDFNHKFEEILRQRGYWSRKESLDKIGRQKEIEDQLKREILQKLVLKLTSGLTQPIECLEDSGGNKRKIKMKGRYGFLETLLEYQELQSYFNLEKDNSKKTNSSVDIQSLIEKLMNKIKQDLQKMEIQQLHSIVREIDLNQDFQGSSNKLKRWSRKISHIIKEESIKMYKSYVDRRYDHFRHSSKRSSSKRTSFGKISLLNSSINRSQSKRSLAFGNQSGFKNSGKKQSKKKQILNNDSLISRGTSKSVKSKKDNKSEKNSLFESKSSKKLKKNVKEDCQQIQKASCFNLAEAKTKKLVTLPKSRLAKRSGKFQFLNSKEVKALIQESLTIKQQQMKKKWKNMNDGDGQISSWLNNSSCSQTSICGVNINDSCTMGERTRRQKLRNKPIFNDCSFVSSEEAEQTIRQEFKSFKSIKKSHKIIRSIKEIQNDTFDNHLLEKRGRTRRIGAFIKRQKNFQVQIQFKTNFDKQSNSKTMKNKGKQNKKLRRTSQELFLFGQDTFSENQSHKIESTPLITLQIDNSEFQHFLKLYQTMYRQMHGGLKARRNQENQKEKQQYPDDLLYKENGQKNSTLLSPHDYIQSEKLFFYHLQTVCYSPSETNILPIEAQTQKKYYGELFPLEQVFVPKEKLAFPYSPIMTRAPSVNDLEQISI